jgi:Protein of unknown function (DUF3168)
MSCEVALRERLLTVCPRVTPIVRSQATPLPAITYERIGELRNDPLVAPDPLTLAHFQIDVWASTYEHALALATDTRRALAHYQAPPDLAAIWFDTQRQLYEDETYTYRVLMEFDIFTEED